MFHIVKHSSSSHKSSVECAGGALVDDYDLTYAFFEYYFMLRSAMPQKTEITRRGERMIRKSKYWHVVPGSASCFAVSGADSPECLQHW